MTIWGIYERQPEKHDTPKPKLEITACVRRLSMWSLMDNPI